MNCSFCLMKENKVFLYKFDHESSTFNFSCGACIALVVDIQKSAGGFRSLQTFESTFKEHLNESYLDYQRLSKAFLESKQSKEISNPDKLKDLNELKGYICKLENLSRSLEDEVNNLKRVLKSYENRTQTNMSTRLLDSFKTFENNFNQLKDLERNVNDINDLYNCYCELKLKSLYSEIKKDIKELNECGLNINSKNLSYELESVLSLTENSIYAIKKLALDIIKRDVNANSNQKASSAEKTNIAQIAEPINIASNNLVSCSTSSRQDKIHPKIFIPNVNNQSILREQKLDPKHRFAIYLNNNVMTCYSIKLKVWSKTDIKPALQKKDINFIPSHAYTNFGEGIFLCGGKIKEIMTADCFVISLHPDKSKLGFELKKYPPMIKPRGRHCLVHHISTHQERYVHFIFCLSGYGTTHCEYTIINDFQDSNENNKWHELPSLNLMRSNASTILINRVMYIYGGIDTNEGSKYHNSFESISLGCLENEKLKWNLIEFKKSNAVSKSSCSYMELTTDSDPIIYIIGGYTGYEDDKYYLAELFTNKEWKFTEMKFSKKLKFQNQNFKLGVDNNQYAFDSSGMLYYFDGVNIKHIPE